MTTKHSPLTKLLAQARLVAATIKAAERGEPIDVRFAEKIAEARGRPGIKLGIAMDDKFITIDMPWTVIHETSEASLAEYVLKQMREQRDNA